MVAGPADTLLCGLQSPFIGRRTPLVEDGSPILYLRYKDVSEVLLVRQQPVCILPLAMACRSRMDPAHPSDLAHHTCEQEGGKGGKPTAAGARASVTTSGAPGVARTAPSSSQRPTAQEALLARAGAAQQRVSGVTPSVPAAGPAGVAESKPKKEKHRKKQRDAEVLSADQPPAAAAATAVSADDQQQQPKKKRRKEVKAAEAVDAAKAVSGPSNADEAASIRAALGFGPPAAVAESPSAAAVTNSFSFGFASRPAAPAASTSSSEDSEEEDEEAMPVQPPQPSGNGIVEPQPATAASAPRPVPAAVKPLQPSSGPAEQGQAYIPRR